MEALGLAVPGATQLRRGLGRALDMPRLLLLESGQPGLMARQSSLLSPPGPQSQCHVGTGPSGASESLHSQRWNLLAVQMRKPRWGVGLPEPGQGPHLSLRSHLVLFLSPQTLGRSSLWQSFSSFLYLAPPTPVSLLLLLAP